MYVFKDGDASKGRSLPIKIWAKEGEIEQGALDQITNVAYLPFAYHHIALMPDAHQGYGMPIGGVAALNGAISPNMVGVDIGCFTGNTKVPLLNGTQKTLRELKTLNKPFFYVYSLTGSGRVVPGKATAIKTYDKSMKRKLLEITISGGEKIRCTLDHRFMLIDGSYKEAQYLQPFDSLMPLYRSYETKDGYEHVKTTSGSSHPTHRIVAEHFLGVKPYGWHTHHKDDNWFNNDPSNLEYKDNRLHSSEHRINNPIFGTEKFKQQRLKILGEKGFYDESLYPRKRETALKNLRILQQSPKWKKASKEAGKRNGKFLSKFNKINNATPFTCACGRVVYGKGAFARHQGVCQNTQNHKVLSIKPLAITESVYCLQVEKYHNFALAAGVFVHNCGMRAIKTTLHPNDISTEDLKDWMSKIRDVVPVGVGAENKRPNKKDMPDSIKNIMNTIFIKDSITPIVYNGFQKATKQLGTLGAGNHFIEIQKGGGMGATKENDGFIWIMVHSGSRRLGFDVAEHYNKKAIALNESWHSKVEKKIELAFLPVDSKEGYRYSKEMDCCLDYAKANRKVMMDRIVESIDAFEVEYEVDVHHNYAAHENHFNRNVWVHRKGAIRARAKEIGIVPGSQGTASYIVRGLGNPDSFCSASHGAGRKMSRSRARKELVLDDVIRGLDEKGIIHSVRYQKQVDEAPQAYKDIDRVMENQIDLVEIVYKLTPLAVVKG